ETVRYKIVVDQDDVPEAIPQGGGRRTRQLPGEAGGGGSGFSNVKVRRLDANITDISQIFARVMRMPNFPGILADSATLLLNKPSAVRERAAATAATAGRSAVPQLDITLRRLIPVLAGIGQMAWGARGIYAGSRQMLMASLGANGSGILRGGIGAIGGAAH